MNSMKTKEQMFQVNIEPSPKKPRNRVFGKVQRPEVEELVTNNTSVGRRHCLPKRRASVKGPRMMIWSTPIGNNWAKVQMLPTIPALLPSLVAEEVSIVQAIDRPQAQVYYMNINAGTTKGTVTSGDALISAQTGHATSEGSRKFASDQVIGESLATGNGVATSITGTLARKPVIAGSVTINYTIGSTTYEATDDGAGGFTGTNINTGSSAINYTTSAYTIVVTTAYDNYSAVTADYRFNVEKDPDGIGELNLEVTSSNVDAEIFPVKLQYSVFSAINLQKIHGLVLADEGMKFATQEIRFAIDQVVLEAARTAATSASGATSPGTFNATLGSGEPWIWKMHEFNKYISIGSKNIFEKTLRAVGNVIVAGGSVWSLIEQLQNYKPATGLGTKPPSGPHVAGTLGNRLVIYNPFYTSTEYVELFRGDNYLFAGLSLN